MSIVVKVSDVLGQDYFVTSKFSVIFGKEYFITWIVD